MAEQKKGPARVRETRAAAIAAAVVNAVSLEHRADKYAALASIYIDARAAFETLDAQAEEEIHEAVIGALFPYFERLKGRDHNLGRWAGWTSSPDPWKAARGVAEHAREEANDETLRRRYRQAVERSEGCATGDASRALSAFSAEPSAGAHSEKIENTPTANGAPEDWSPRMTKAVFSQKVLKGKKGTEIQHYDLREGRDFRRISDRLFEWRISSLNDVQRERLLGWIKEQGEEAKRKAEKDKAARKAAKKKAAR